MLDRGASPHVVKYLKPAKALSERIGTALINGSWFVRRLQRPADHVVIMLGHRHIDWIGECGGLLIVSAPSPVMAAADDQDNYFYVLAVGADGKLSLLEPDRIDLRGRPFAKTSPVAADLPATQSGSEFVKDDSPSISMEHLPGQSSVE